MSKEEKEIKKEEKRKLPTITIAIVAHGEDLINEKITIDPNVRIYSRAGRALCFGMIHSNPLGFVEDLYYTTERTTGEDKRTTYEMLQVVADHYKMPEHDKEFIKTIIKEAEKYPKSVKHTLKTIAKKNHSQIYTPFYDHSYDFTDTTNIFSGQSRIAVLETMNYTPTNKVIDYENLPFSYYDNNLALQKYYITQPDIDIRNRAQINFRKEMILRCLLNFTLDHDSESELNEYSNILFKIIPFVDNFKILNEFQNPTSVIHQLVKPEDNEIITKKAHEFPDISKITNEADKSRQIEERRQFLFQVDDIEKEEQIIPSIKLSQIIAFLKSEGFKVINIIDFSCRYVEGQITQEKIRQLSEGQDMGMEEIRKHVGGKKKRKTRRKKRLTKRRAKRRKTVKL